MENKNLPTLQELHHDVAVAFKNDQFKLLLNQQPPAKWLKQHPTAKTKNEQGQYVAAQYLPIDKVELMMDRIFQEWRVEVLREGVMFQSIYVTIRLHYKNPITSQWEYHDGVGAKSVQVDSGSSAADLSKIKDAAVMMAFPSAKSYAIKDAAEHLGDLFGRNINRKDVVSFAGSYSTPVTIEPVKPESLNTEADVLKAVSLGQISKEEAKSMIANIKEVVNV